MKTQEMASSVAITGGEKTIHQRSHTDKIGPLGHLQIKPNLILIILQMVIILQFDVMLLAEKALLQRLLLINEYK